MSLLSVKNINTGYGKKQVLFNVNLEVEDGQTVLLIGSNGSGKSTLFKAIYGILPLWKNEEGSIGKIRYIGDDLIGIESHSLINRNIMYIPQQNELFEDMTVEQNLRVAVLYKNSKAVNKEQLNEVYDELNILKEKRKQIAFKLSGGERKLLTMGMVLMNQPKLLLYDEPLAGLSGNNVKIVLDWLLRLKERGTTLVIIEHRIKELMGLADKFVGLKLGRKSEKKLNNLEHIKAFIV